MIVRCPSCGMTQMASASCKGCRKPLAGPAPVPRGGGILAHVNKNLLMEVFRKKWIVRDPRGLVLLVAKEDSILRALLRRFATKLVLLNFILCRGQTDEVIGEFNRKFTIRDRYVLDLTRDRVRSLDRRIAVAIGVLLDTAERR